MAFDLDSLQQMDGFPVEVTTMEGVHIRSRYKVPWDDRHDARDALIGHLYPGLELGTYYPIATEIAISRMGTMVGDPSPNPDYKWAVLDVRYDTVRGNLSGGEPETVLDYYSESYTDNSEFQTLDVMENKYVWANESPIPEGCDNVPRDGLPGVLRPGGELDITLYYKAAVLPSWLALVGHTNSEEFTPLSPTLSALTFPAETLLWASPRFRTTVKSDGSEVVTIDFRLLYKPNWDGETARGWNWFWHNDGWYQIYDIDTEEPIVPFPPASFDVIYSAPS